MLKEAEAGAKVLDPCRRHGIGEQTFYRWKGKYAGLDVKEIRRLRQLVAELTLDNRALKGLLEKKF